MTEKNPATEQATTVEAQSVTAHSVGEKAVLETEKSGASTSDKRAAIKQALRPQLRRTSVVEDYAAELDEMASLTHALNGSKKDDNKSDAWKIGYPYDTKLGRKAYEKEKRALQIELLKLQLWAKATGQKILIIDACHTLLFDSSLVHFYSLNLWIQKTQQFLASRRCR